MARIYRRIPTLIPSSLPRPNKLPLAPCDNTTLESRNHILTECPRYTNHRKILKKASRHLSLPVLLGTTKGISALAEFITKTGAFSRTGNPPTKPQAPSFINEPIPILNPAVDPTLVFDDGG